MKELINTSGAPDPIGPYNQAVKAGGFLFVSGQIAIDPASGALVQTDIAAEAHQVMQNLGAILRAAGLDYRHIVKTTIFLRTMEDFAAVNAVYGSYFEGEYPARETVAVAGLPKQVNVEISVIALAQ
ncbi:MAG: RidA family protein [Bacteroidia bacterium]|nr:RidA family protein [Bacteroidia bacterium]